MTKETVLLPGLLSAEIVFLLESPPAWGFCVVDTIFSIQGINPFHKFQNFGAETSNVSFLGDRVAEGSATRRVLFYSN
jgi:hypothetical protein